MSIQNFIGKTFAIQSTNHKLTTGNMTLKSGDIIRVIAVGEDGRGRIYGIVPVVNVKSRIIQEEKSKYDDEICTWKKFKVYVEEFLPLKRVRLSLTKAGEA